MNTAAPTRPVVRYHGGKWRLAPWIISHLPPHRVYVEPFAGAASVLMRKPPARIEVLNDRHQRIVSAFRVLRDLEQSARLANMLRCTPYADAEYRAARQPAADPVEDARRLIVLGHQAHGSTGASGGKLTGWRRGVRPHGPTSAMEWHGIHNYVAQWADRLRSVYLEDTDAIACIARWDGPDTVFYVDPPYVGETRAAGVRGYGHDMTDDDHRALAQSLRSVAGHVIVSGYPSPLYDELFCGWRRIEREAMADANKRAKEVLWISPHTEAANYSLFGEGL